MKTPALQFILDGKHFENEVFKDDGIRFPDQVFLKRKSQMTVDDDCHVVPAWLWTGPLN